MSDVACVLGHMSVPSGRVLVPFPFEGVVSSDDGVAPPPDEGVVAGRG